MVHWRSFGYDFKARLLLEVLSSLYRPTAFADKSKTSQAVCREIYGETAFTQDEDNVESFSSIKWKCCAATGNPDFTSETYRVLLVPAFIPSMFSICRQQGKIRRSMQHLPNIETFAESLSSTPGFVQPTPLVYSSLLTFKCSQTHWHTKQSFSESQYPDEA